MERRQDVRVPYGKLHLLLHGLVPLAEGRGDGRAVRVAGGDGQFEIAAK